MVQIGSVNMTIPEVVKVDVNFIPSITAIIRNKVPCGNLSDAEIGLALNITLLGAAIIAHLISKLWHGRDGKEKWLDRQSFFEMSTENKRLSVDKANKDKEIKRLSEENYELEARVNSMEEDARNVKEKLKNIEGRLEEEQEANILLQKENTRAKEEYEKIHDELRQMEHAYLHKDNELTELKTHYEESKKIVANLENCIMDRKEENAKLLDQFEQVNNHLKEQVSENKELERQLSGMASFLDASEKQGSDVVESGATVLKTPQDLRDIAKMKSENDKLEQDNQKLRQLLELANVERQKIEQEIDEFKSELQQKTKDIEACASDRRGADERASQLLSLLQQANLKIEEKEQSKHKIREEIEMLKGDLNTIRDETRLKDDKIRLLDGDVKKWRNDYIKLETTAFSKEKEYLKQIHDLQKLAAIAPHDAFNFNTTLISDQDNNNPKPDQNMVLWDFDMDTTMQRSFISDENRFFQHAPLAKSKSGRSRRSDRVVQGWSNSADNLQNKENDRRRSHSHGRQANCSALPPQPKSYYKPPMI